MMEPLKLRLSDKTAAIINLVVAFFSAHNLALTYLYLGHFTVSHYG